MSACPIPRTSRAIGGPNGVVQQINHAWLNRYEPEARGARVLTDDAPGVDLSSRATQRGGAAELHALFGRDGRSW